MPNAPLLDILRQVYGIGDGDSPAEVSRKIRRGLKQVGMDPDQWAPHVLFLFGVLRGAGRLKALSRLGVRTRVFEALSRAALERSRKEALVLAVEDVQWLGPKGRDFLRYFVERLPAFPLLLLLTYRPEFRPPWLGHSYATQLALQPLSHAESFAYARSLLPPGAASDPVVALIVEQARGNPLFIQALARSVVEDPTHAPIDPALLGPLLTQMSRLSQAARGLLEMAAMIGPSVPARLLEAVWGRPRGLAPLLAELRRSELLQDRVVGAEAAYVFSHPLYRRVLYESLSGEERERLRAAVSRAVEALGEPGGPERRGLLAGDEGSAAG
jgi:predicted ATPase